MTGWGTLGGDYTLLSSQIFQFEAWDNNQTQVIIPSGSRKGLWAAKSGQGKGDLRWGQSIIRSCSRDGDQKMESGLCGPCGAWLLQTGPSREFCDGFQGPSCSLLMEAQQG